MESRDNGPSLSGKPGGMRFEVEKLALLIYRQQVRPDLHLLWCYRKSENLLCCKNNRSKA